MKLWLHVKSFLSFFARPIAANRGFFFFMYLLGMVCAWIEVPAGTKAGIYSNQWLELFLDLYVLAALLALIPVRVRRWVRAVLYVVAYATTIADVFCFVRFDSTLNPSMLLLAGETDGREAYEFLESYLTADLLLSPVGVVLLILLVHILSTWIPFLFTHFGRRLRLFYGGAHQVIRAASPVLGLCCLVLVVWSAISSWHNKREMAEMFSLSTIGEVEHELTTPDCAVMYTPVYRLAFSIFSNELASQQVVKLIEAKDAARVDSCSYRTPTIVLIIGESYGRHHSQLYGYFMPTTPRQLQMRRSHRLVQYSDVVSPWNLTSFVFKNVFSMHVVGQRGEWCDYPLFPELFRKAGYRTAFITNQFLPKAKEAVYDFSGGFFLNHPELSEAMFDVRNTALHPLDEGLLKDYDAMVHEGKISIGPKADGQMNHNLVIFHLIGQHVSYYQRYDHRQRHFTEADYRDERPELSKKQRMILADYDNACLYNDSIVDQIVRRFSKENAVVVYMPDHGEECYEDHRGFICRQHSAKIDYALAHYEFEIPFWIYCTRKFISSNPDLYHSIRQARNRRFMTDALPHLLLHLAGISAPDYHAEYDVLSGQYDEHRPRLLKNTTDYDKVRDAQMKSKSKKQL